MDTELASCTSDQLRELAERLLVELYHNPRQTLERWAKITHQSALVDMDYLGQHLVSVVTGLRGSGSAARGQDLIDGSEVKTCSRSGQLGQCKACGARVMAQSADCPNCGSSRVDRKYDSHWIFSIKTEAELRKLLQSKWIYLGLFDDDPSRNPENQAVRVRVWIVNPRYPLVQEFFKRYFEKFYTARKAAGRAPAPCNLHPLKHDFFDMDPHLVYQALISEDGVKTVEFNPRNEKAPHRGARHFDISEDPPIGRRSKARESDIAQIKARWRLGASNCEDTTSPARSTI